MAAFAARPSGSAPRRHSRWPGTDGPINGDRFEAHVTKVLVPRLRAGDVVIMDNLSSHRRATAKGTIEAADIITPR